MPNATVAILRNPTSGSGAGRIQILRLIRELRHQNLKPKLFSRRERLRDWMDSSAEAQDLQALVAAGGDGTVGEIINRYPDAPLAILPLGTENLLARFLKIPRCGQFVGRMIAAGQQQRIDVGEINGRRFTLMASLGFDAAVVHVTDGRRKGTITKRSYVLPILQLLRQYRFPAFRVWLDDAEEPLLARHAVIVNVPRYALGIEFASTAAPSSGLLDLRLFQHRTPFQMVCDFYKVFTRKHESAPGVVCRQIRSLRSEGDEPIPVQVDGDPAGTTPVDVTIHAAACLLCVPAST